MTTTVTSFGLRILSNGTAWVNKFFFEPASARPLAAFRIGLSGLLLWQAFLMYESFFDFFSATGFVQEEVSTTLRDPSLPRLDWLIDALVPLGISENLGLTALGFAYVIGLLLLFVGLFTRPSALCVWLLHWALTNTGYSGSYGADMYAHLFLFYLVWTPSGDAISLDKLFKRVDGKPTYMARFGLRVLQLHMCVSYLASGLEKASGEQWWNGEVLWRALNTPDYSVGDFHWLAHVPVIPMVGGWIVLAIETLYCVLIWHRKTRLWWVAATCVLHLGIGIFLKLPIFGVLMCVPTIALFAIKAQPRLDGSASVSP